jgi:hypothetical protein
MERNIFPPRHSQSTSFDVQILDSSGKRQRMIPSGRSKQGVVDRPGFKNAHLEKGLNHPIVIR